ncbi:hypothetical protein J7T55_010498 [Diaporthe amygdali]|uniref:uncharacterized protein n=1 Tax=Phomopsis amygdali TaxID=1214568 RepID=UPI0022FEA55B|nr:uncharacterized protein J7T55_010498 [Diaporthe amygdali]KAJ0115675.1 hypothetical protein J7T55_010498 [Diaporthe amygdali]
MASILRPLLRAQAGIDKGLTTAVDESSLARPITPTLVAAHQTTPAQSPSMASNSSQSRPSSPARVFPTSGFHEIPKSQKVDEENFSWYSPEDSYRSASEQAQREIAAFKHLRKVLRDGSAADELGGANYISWLRKTFELDHPKVF